jgi:hypothetical protein
VPNRTRLGVRGTREHKGRTEMANINVSFDQCFFEDAVWSLDPLVWPKEDEDAYWATPFTEWMETVHKVSLLPYSPRQVPVLR